MISVYVVSWLHCFIRGRVTPYSRDFVIGNLCFNTSLYSAVDELLPPGACYRTDTLMWNAKGFLSRTEKLADSGDGGDKIEGEDISGKKPVKNERDENVSCGSNIIDGPLSL